MVSENEKKYLEKIHRYIYLKQFVYLVPILVLVLVVSAVLALVFGYRQLIGEGDEISLAMLIMGLMFFALFLWLLIFSIKKRMTMDSPPFYGLYTCDGILKRVVTRESAGTKSAKVSRLFLHEVSILLPPYMNPLKDKLAYGLETEQKLINARFIMTTPETPFKKYPQGYLLSFEGNHFIDKDYDRFIKPYIFLVDGFTVFMPFLLIFMAGLPFYVNWADSFSDFIWAHWLSLAVISISTLGFLAQLPFYLKNRALKYRHQRTIPRGLPERI